VINTRLSPALPRRCTRAFCNPALPEVLNAADLHRLYSPSYDERQWAPTVARTLTSQVALLVQLKTFQAVGRFLPMADIPTVAAGIWVAGSSGVLRWLVFRFQRRDLNHGHRESGHDNERRTVGEGGSICPEPVADPRRKDGRARIRDDEHGHHHANDPAEGLRTEAPHDDHAQQRENTRG